MSYIEIPISKKIREIVLEQGKRQDKGGYSNLSKNDLAKASRLEFQYTGVYGEVAWYLYRYGSYDRLFKIWQDKDAEFEATRKGDDGFDDAIVIKKSSRKLDIKTSHAKSIDDVKKLNLVVPPRELHHNMVYVAAFTIGQDRLNVDKVALAGWCFNEDITEPWFIDPKKYAVRVRKLNPIESLVDTSTWTNSLNVSG